MVAFLWSGLVLSEVAQKADDDKIDDESGWTSIPPETMAFNGEMSAWDTQESTHWFMATNGGGNGWL
jgi:hypothetical protein